MFDTIKRIFSRKKKIKKFSSTTTDATIGSNSKLDLNPEIKEIVNIVHKADNINNSQLNKLMAFYFNKPPIEHHLYKLNKAFSDSMCFELDAVNTIFDKEKDVENIVLNMKEVTYNIELSLRISVRDFHEILKPLEFKPAPIKQEDK